MKQYQRILICISSPARDFRMLAFAARISRLASSREVHLLHVQPEPPTTDDDAADAPLADDAVVTTEELETLASEYFKGHGGEKVVCQVVTGAPLLELLRYGHEKDVDLIVIGRHPAGEGMAEDEAVLARRLTRKATCSVLVLPEEAQLKGDRILVPVRDSECSANAVAEACRISETANAEVLCLNVYPVRSGYRSVGSTLEEHEAALAGWAERECEQILTRVNTGTAKVAAKCLPDLYGNPVPVILDAIDTEGADVVVIGARGRTGAAGVLLGHVTESLIQKCSVPVLAVKMKGECVGLLEALLTLAG